MPYVVTALALVLAGQAPLAGTLQDQEEPVGTLWLAYHPEAAPVPFTPREADIIFFTSITPLFNIEYPLARSWHPYHSALVVRRATGELMILENGGQGIKFSTFRRIPERIQSDFEKHRGERIWVRRNLRPLTTEQSQRLTAFAEAAQARPFSPDRRMAMLILPGRPLPRTTPDQDNWFCSEIVLEALISAGLVSSRGVRPQSLTPHELLRDCRIDLSYRWSPIYIFSPDENPPPRGAPLARP
jgi:hypothetical protein